MQNQISKMAESKSLKVEVISRETIKPSSPSPNPDHQGSFKLSLLDQFMVHFYVPVLLFYKPSTTSPLGGAGLKSSLSETLTRFYPFAGRLKDELSISCNDEGVEFSEAQVLDCSLSDVLDIPNQKQLNLLLPSTEMHQDLTSCPLFLVQVCFFKSCGGIALGVKFSHKVADAITITSFIRCWADYALGNGDDLVIPELFSASTLFPPTDELPLGPEIQPSQNRQPIDIRTIRLVFEQTELASLQAKATGTKNPRPTRFEAVSAFLWQTVMASGKKSRSQLVWAVNLRPKLKPTLAEHCFGNLFGSAVHKRQAEEEVIDEKDLPSLAYHLRRGTIDLCNNFIQALKGEQSAVGIYEIQKNGRNLFRKAFAGTVELCSITSWCKLPFYEADFGWGKPLWVTCGAFMQLADAIVLMDTRDGDGMEAWVTLTEEKMAVFECNNELQMYASFNPSAAST